MNTSEMSNIQKIVGSKTPPFFAHFIVTCINALENFRIHNFNNPFIFYGVLIFVVVLIVRFFWRMFF